MDQQVNFKVEKKNYPKNIAVIIQGSDTKEIYFLHTGTIEIKRSGKNIENLKEQEIIKNSKRVGVIEAPSIFGVQNIFSDVNHETSYITLSDCQITRYMIPSNDFLGFFKANTPITLNILLTILDQVRKRLIGLKQYVDFIGGIEKLSDNMRLLYLHVNNIKKDELYQKFINNGGIFPPKIESNFLLSDFSTILGKTYGDPKFDPKAKYDWEKIEFFYHLLKAKPASFISLITTEIKIFLFIFQNLTLTYNQINSEIEKYASGIENLLDDFFLNNSSSFNLIYSIEKKVKSSDLTEKGITKAIVRICRNIENMNKQLGGREYVEVFSKYDTLNAGVADVSDEKSSVDEEGKYKKMLKDSTKNILNYSTLSEDARSKITKNLERMRKLTNEQLTSSEHRGLIKNLQDDYYELYLNILLKAIKNKDNLPDYIKLFLYFSFIDEKLISEKQLEFLYNSLGYFTLNQNTDYPIITLFDYLQLIYDKTEEPSLSERGEFRKIITKAFSKNEKKVEDTPQGRLEFEIDNMVRMSMRVTSDNFRSFIPYLRDDFIRGALSQVLVSPKKLDVFMKKIVSIDYTLFYRELTWKIPGKSELIQKEVRPFLILIPNAGSRIQMWQEMTYNMRNSKARFLIPVIFNGDLNKNLIFSCGHFRWNLNKALVSNWMDPVDGGLTGAYYDYEMGYKKNQELSFENKEKIKNQMNSIKIDKNRFAHDYFEWVVYENEGVPKLNKVLRKIFYRLIPFPKNIRENISKLPVYSELDRKFEIIREREFKKIEAKYKKYKEGDQIPADLQAYLEMMQK